MIFDQIQNLFEVSMLLSLNHLKRKALKGSQTGSKISNHLKASISLFDKERACSINYHEHIIASVNQMLSCLQHAHNGV